MAIELIDYPLGIVRSAEIVRVHRCSVGEQRVIIGLVRPQQADMKLQVNSSLDEFTRELQRIVGGLKVCL
jgi:hypothetical protein